MSRMTALAAVIAAVACAWPAATSPRRATTSTGPRRRRLPRSRDARQDVTITQAVTTHYASFGGWFMANTNPDDGWYMGLQAGGLDFQGNPRAQMIFSLWNSTSATPGPGAQCGPFDGEGIRRSCRLAIDWAIGHPYRYAMVKVAGTSSVWSGSVIDAVTNAVHEVGRITAPAANIELRSFYSFLEYWGGGCTHPTLAAQFSNPQLNGGAAQATYPAPTRWGPAARARSTSAQAESARSSANGAARTAVRRAGRRAAACASARCAHRRPMGADPRRRRRRRPAASDDAAAGRVRSRAGSHRRRWHTVDRDDGPARHAEPLVAAPPAIVGRQARRAHRRQPPAQAVTRHHPPARDRPQQQGRAHPPSGRYTLSITHSGPHGVTRRPPIALTIRRR